MQETALDRAFYDTGCASVLPTFQPPWTHRTAGNGMENIGLGEASAVRRNSHGALLVASSSAIRYNVRDENEILSFYMDYTANYKRIKKLPAIFPIVLYNGSRKWSAPTRISDLIEAEPSLGAYAIDFQYLLLNEKAYNKERLLTIRNIVSTLFLAEGHYDIALLEQNGRALSNLRADVDSLVTHTKLPPLTTGKRKPPAQS